MVEVKISVNKDLASLYILNRGDHYEWTYVVTKDHKRAKDTLYQGVMPIVKPELPLERLISLVLKAVANGMQGVGGDLLPK